MEPARCGKFDAARGVSGERREKLNAENTGSRGAQRAATRDRRPTAGHRDRGKADRKRPMNGGAFAIGPFAIRAARSAGHAWQLPLRVPLLFGDPCVLFLPRALCSLGAHCGGLRHTDGSNRHTPLQRRHSHHSQVMLTPRLRTSVLPQRTHDTGREGSVARRPPRRTPRRSGISGLRRSISGHVWVTVRLYPEDGHALSRIISSLPWSNRRIPFLCTDPACTADPPHRSRLTP